MCDASSYGRVVGERGARRGGRDHLAYSGYSDGVYRRADGGGSDAQSSHSAAIEINLPFKSDQEKKEE